MPITDPTDISGLAEWWDPDDIAVADGATISTWTGTNGIVFTGPSTAEPILRDGTRHPAGHKTPQFVGTGKRMTAANAALNNGTTTISVMYLPFKMPGTSNYWILNKVNAQVQTYGLRVDGATNAITAVIRLNGTETTARTITASSFIVEAKPIIITLRYDGTTMSLRANGSEIGSLSVSGAIDTDSPGDLVLANHPSSFISNNGCIGDVVIYNNALGTTDLDDLEAWMLARWSIADYYDDWVTTIAATEQANIVGKSLSKPTIRELDANTWIMFVTIDFAQVDYYTAPKSDPHNWTRNPGGVIIDAATSSVTDCRALSAIKDGSTWHILVDDFGDFHHFSGTSLASLTDHGQVFAGQGADWEVYVRHPYIATTQIGGEWAVFYGGRTATAPGSNFGATGVVFTSDFTTFTNRQQILDVTPLWWERTDVSAPCAWVRDGQWEMVYVGYNDGVTDFPHQFGLAHSSDGTTWTRIAQEVPILVCANDGFRDDAMNTPELFDDGTDIHLYFSGGPGPGIYSLEVGQAFLDAGAAGGDATVTPAVVATSASLPAVGASASSTVTPGAISSTVAVPSSALSLGKTVSPDAIATLVNLLQASPQAGGSATVNPAVLQALTSIPQAAVSGGAQVTPAAIQSVVGILQTGLSTQANVRPESFAVTAQVLQALGIGIMWLPVARRSTTAVSRRGA